MDPSPLVSIVIPVYNGADYLRQAIESALAQTYPNVEVLVVNDGSTDGGATAAIARSCGGRIRYFEKANGGVASALNAGIREMRGEWFSWLSHDDLYAPRKVEAEVARALQHPDPVVLFSDYEQVDSDGRLLAVQRVRTGALPFRFALVASDPVNGCTTLVPRACFDAVGVFDETLRTAQDYDMWFRLAKRFRFVHLPEVLVKSRLHPRQGTRTIPTFFEEASRQMIRLVGELGADEARAAGLGPPSVPFTRVALAMKLRGFDAVAQAALARSRQLAAEDDAWARARRLVVAVACRVLTRKMKPSWWLARLRAAAASRRTTP